MNNSIGNKLLRYVKALSPNRAFIPFRGCTRRGWTAGYEQGKKMAYAGVD
ncbi:MAG: hypothetical protein ACLU4J_14445 [Butyricimonas paravirosa]